VRRETFLAFSLCFLAILCASAAFEVPSPNERQRALGDLRHEPAALRNLLALTDDFLPVTPPQRTDWLSTHPEKGQTFDEYLNSHANRPDYSRHVIYLLPIGEFPEELCPPLESLRAYAAAFFQMEVKILPSYYPHDLEFTPRNNPHSRQRQVLTGSILDFLKLRLPPDAYCLLGVTMTDLYPQRSWNFVFGQASISDRVGVYSFARYNTTEPGTDPTNHIRELFFQRSTKVLVHETAHMFGLLHCIYFDCVVNGSNGLDETDAQPQFLCPICLRKLHHAIGFDPVLRYEQLAKFYHREKWYSDFDWVQRQLKKSTPASNP